MKNDERAPAVVLTDAEALAGRVTVVSWEEHERLCAIAVAREHHRMVARTADAAARLAAVEAERDRLLATADALAEKAPEQRLLEAIFATAGCRCGCGAPRWDEDKTVLRFGWDTPDRCGRCGEDLPAPDAGQREAHERAEVVVALVKALPCYTLIDDCGMTIKWIDPAELSAALAGLRLDGTPVTAPDAGQCEAKKNLVVRFQAAAHAYLVPHPELGAEEDDRGCLPCLMIAQAMIPALFKESE